LQIQAINDELALQAEVKQPRGKLESSLKYRLDWQRRLVPKFD